MFRPELTRALAYSDGSQGGRPPFDRVMMFKVLVIRAANNLSDEHAEFLINDRLSFMRFLGLSLSDRVPDAHDLSVPREAHQGQREPLFERFDAELRAAGYIAMGGQIVDASLIAAPKQRNTEDEKAAIRDGRKPKDWKTKAAKLKHTDRDARWTVTFSKAKTKPPGGTVAPIDIPSRFSATREPCVDRPRTWVDPPLGRDRRGGLRGRAPARGSARQAQHGVGCGIQMLKLCKICAFSVALCVALM